jgi:hypothetical protein
MKRVATVALAMLALSGGVAYAAAPEAVTNAILSCCEAIMAACGCC